MNDLSFIKYQFGLFADYSKQEMDKKTISIIDVLSDYDFIKQEEIPSPNIIQPRQILNLWSPTKLIGVEFRSDRIDIILVNRVISGKIQNRDIEEVIDTFSDISFKINSIVTVKNNRLALILETNIKLLKNFEEFSIKYPKFYENSNLYEWGLRLNKRIELSVNKHYEILNCITHIQKIDNVTINESLSIDGYTVLFDINTAQENRLMRFNNEDVQSFINISFKVYGDIYAGLNQTQE